MFISYEFQNSTMSQKSSTVMGTASTGPTSRQSLINSCALMCADVTSGLQSAKPKRSNRHGNTIDL